MKRVDWVRMWSKFATAALLMYFPANLLPIMSFEYYGARESSTVMGGASWVVIESTPPVGMA